MPGTAILLPVIVETRNSDRRPAASRRRRQRRDLVVAAVTIELEQIAGRITEIYQRSGVAPIWVIGHVVMIEPANHAVEIQPIKIKRIMRIFVIRSSPTFALLGQPKDRIRNSVLDKTWNLVHQFSA